MLRSERTRSGSCFCKCKRASKPSFAEETSYPSLASNHETVLRTLASLSTTNIRVLGEDMRETSTDYFVEAAVFHSDTQQVCSKLHTNGKNREISEANLRTNLQSRYHLLTRFDN